MQGKQYNLLYVEVPTQDAQNMESAALPAASDGVAASDLAAVSASAPADATCTNAGSNLAGVLSVHTSISVLARV